MFRAIKEDDLVKFKYWMEHNKWTPNTTQDHSLLHGYTVFTRCVRMGARRCFEWCLRNDADINLAPAHGYPALAYALKNMYFFRALIRAPSLEINTSKLDKFIPRHLNDADAHAILRGIIDHPNYYPDVDDATTFLRTMLSRNRHVTHEYLDRGYRYDVANLLEHAISTHDEIVLSMLLPKCPPKHIHDLKRHAIAHGNLSAFRGLMRLNPECDQYIVDTWIHEFTKDGLSKYRNTQLEILDYLLTLGVPANHHLSYSSIVENEYGFEVLAIMAKHGCFIPDNSIYAFVLEAVNGIQYLHSRKQLNVMLRYLLCYRPTFDITADDLLKKLITAASKWELESTQSRLGKRQYRSAEIYEPEMVKIHRLICDVVGWHFQNLDSVGKKQDFICLVNRLHRVHPIIGLNAVLEPYIGTL